ncbi:Hypothetical Protein PANA_3145 [Pantoea ananatis LMG 20103]|uniref:FRG domain-containing protein n=1 Tax=Pantoea ananatis (strain LMG 20103) TaxID=706191 RepID=D4GM44_PANAM|nr:FRG domain-containing protein [Pantoea ananatis]ADD78312.1 Hypothetical Protein PANA_3145 [Pantoea ananatis LMG 20103]
MSSIDYTVHEFQSADDLFNMLSPTNIKSKGEMISLKFRGHANSDWKLIPSALRPGFHLNSSLLGKILNIRDVIVNEVITLNMFAHACDRVGISIPNDSTMFRDEALNPTSIFNQTFLTHPELWPGQRFYEIMAMAQHHGVATRLLDWSESPYVAAYFSASGALLNMEDSEWDKQRLAIWVVRTPLADNLQKLKFIKVPGSVSKHLSSQRGMFSIHPMDSYSDNLTDTLGLEELGLAEQGIDFYKLTLPTTESIRLLYLCSMAGFTAASLFPSADGAGRSVNEELLKKKAIKKLNLNFDGSKHEN